MTGEEIPIWIANFVLMEYGTGAIMSVPGHDVRDHEFARQYDLPIVQVIAPADGTVLDIQAEAYVEHGVCINSGEFDGLEFTAAFGAIADWLEARGRGKRSVNYRLRDWGVSRQRYWGCPVPIINCESCGSVPVPDADLPVVLPEDLDIGGGSSHSPSWTTSSGPAVRNAAIRRSARPIPSTPSWSHRGTSHASLASTTTRECSTSGRSTGCRWISTSAVSSMRSCTSCMRGSSRK